MSKRTASKAMSKTKARAYTRKPKVVTVSSSCGSGAPDEILLAKLMEQHVMENDEVSFADIMKDLGMNDRNTKWRNAWKELKEKGYTERSINSESGPFFTSGFRLTTTGIALAATDEYKQLKTNQPRTNEELHAKIKGKLMNKRGDQIFDLLLQHGSLSRKELSGLLGISDRGANFSYAFQQLKDLGYVENDPAVQGKKKKVRLTDKAFVTPPTVANNVTPDAKKSVKSDDGSE